MDFVSFLRFFCFYDRHPDKKPFGEGKVDVGQTVPGFTCCCREVKAGTGSIVEFRTRGITAWALAHLRTGSFSTLKQPQVGNGAAHSGLSPLTLINHRLSHRAT